MCKCKKSYVNVIVEGVMYDSAGENGVCMYVMVCESAVKVCVVNLWCVIGS